jgi:hypothetical protein
MNNQRARRTPKFRGNDRLKFTAEEQAAIRDAERASGYRSRTHSDAGSRARPRHRLALAIIATLGFLFLPGLIGSVLTSIRPQAPSAERETQVVEGVRPQARVVPNNSTFRFQNHESVTHVSFGTVPPQDIPPAELIHDQKHRSLLTGAATATARQVDENGKVLFVNEINAANPVKVPE